MFGLPAFFHQLGCFLVPVFLSRYQFHVVFELWRSHAFGLCLAEALNAHASAQADGLAAIPGDYQMPEATAKALALAHSRDLAPLRKAATPLLAAIEAGNLDVVGELEAFIAKLDAMAPQMVGAGELADALEAALAEAAIAGAAHSYAKIPHAKHPEAK